MRTRPRETPCAFAPREREELARPAVGGREPLEFERLALLAAREVQVLAALTPENARRERTRLVADVAAGRPARPSWSYAHIPNRHAALRRAIATAEAELSAMHAPGALEMLYLGRLRELGLEAALCEAAGTPAIGRLARERYASRDVATRSAASRLAAAWLGEPGGATAGTPLLSDSPDPSSLLSRMRAAVGRHRLPFLVAIHPSLPALAATGERAVFVAAGRLVHEEDVVRTVLHEIEGHALPRARALQQACAIFRAGTARGVDDQEGRAILLEERAGQLTGRRRRQLAARHKAVEGMLEGASFSDVAHDLVRSHALSPEDAVVVSERVFRGGDGVSPGLGREQVYLESYVYVRDHLARHPEDEALLAEGQISAEAAPHLRGLV